jgi:hypothetical protein
MNGIEIVLVGFPQKKKNFLKMLLLFSGGEVDFIGKMIDQV